MPAEQQRQQPPQEQTPPGHESGLTPQADHGETSYVGHGRLAGKATVITGATAASAAPSPSPSRAKAPTS